MCGSLAAHLKHTYDPLPLTPQMKLHSALIKKNKEEKIEDIVLLKDGFSFYAFLFGPAWFLYHRMWQEFLALLVINISFGIFNHFLSASDKILLEISFIFLVALNANDWRLEHLKKKKYALVNFVFGSDAENAKLRFIENLEANIPQAEFDDSLLNPKSPHILLQFKNWKSCLRRAT